MGEMRSEPCAQHVHALRFLYASTSAPLRSAKRLLAWPSSLIVFYIVVVRLEEFPS